MSEAWRDQAACHPDRRPQGMTRAEWTAIFFPPLGRSVARALAVCSRCPVSSECAAYADANRATTRDGIWGGQTGKRRRMARVGTNDRRRRVPADAVERAIALVDQGVTVAEASRRTGVTRQTINGWRWKESA